MKIIFLDIDGVLNNHGLTAPFKRYDGSIAQPVSGTPDFEYRRGMDAEKVELLNNILDTINDWKLVISSSWHYSFDKECTTQRFLKHFGFKHIEKIIGATVKSIDGRGQQILHWCDNNYVEDFITIDDEPDDINGNRSNVTEYIRKRFEGRVFQPYCDIGLTLKMAEEIIVRCSVVK